MQYEFLKDFPRRMKNVGLYAVLIQNSIQKTTWKQYGFLKTDEQINVIFALLLYVMEQSLKEENCTMDDIGAYLDAVNSRYLKKNLSYEDCRQLADFIVNVILSNEGKPMYFDGYDFEQDAYHIMHISYVENRIVYVDQEIRRTSYYLTDDGYNLLLSTLEIENNMKLSIYEMIFQMHLEKQSYDKAVDEIKNVFNLMRIQLQKIQEAMGKIRRNALNYSVRDYEEILQEDLETIQDTKAKFQRYRQMVQSRVKELEEENINVRKLSSQEEEKLDNLRVIDTYLNRTIDEHQKILGSHFDLKALYTRELEQLSRMSLIRRFSLRTGLYDRILEHADALAGLEYFLRPLFVRDGEKIYNPDKAFRYQRLSKKSEEADTEETLDFDEEAWQAEQERVRREKRKRYRKSLSCLIEKASEKGEISLMELCGSLNREEKEQLIPNVEIFKEVMVELIRNREIDIRRLRKERSQFIQDGPGEFQLNDMLLQLADEEQEAGTEEGGKTRPPLLGIETYRIEDGSTVVFRGVENERGERKDIRCSNVLIRVIREE